MGDRTYVELTVLNRDADFVKTLADYDDVCEGYNINTFGYSEVNYGELKFTDELMELNIPYSYTWQAGGDYPAGTEYFLFNEDGSTKHCNFYLSSVNPEISYLMTLCDKPEELVKFIQEHHKRYLAPSWKHQEEQSLIARAKQLIGA